MEGLIRYTRTALQSGHEIAIISKHKARYEREFGNTVIRYYDRVPVTDFPTNVDVVLSVIRIKHTDTRHIQKGNKRAIIRVVQERELREIMLSCGCIHPVQPAKK